MAIFDDLFLLRAFIRIAENGNISAAGNSLRVAQPTLGRHLASLEEKCVVPAQIVPDRSTRIEVTTSLLRLPSLAECRNVVNLPVT